MTYTIQSYNQRRDAERLVRQAPEVQVAAVAWTLGA